VNAEPLNLYTIRKEISMFINALKRQRLQWVILIAIILLCCFTLTACGTSGAARGARTGAAAGAAGGLIWGLIDGDVVGSMAAGAAVGTASGGAAGYISERQGRKR
jgi:predicted small secreted protein